VLGPNPWRRALRLRSYPQPDYSPKVIEEGNPAPEFTLTSDADEPVSLSDFRGKPVVLYFYPKDDSPAII
jgi:cytochrome oxidase Cu insertion factor (SCO1/SenC/PrrC family)